jgi:hypothetical protein
MMDHQCQWVKITRVTFGRNIGKCSKHPNGSMPDHIFMWEYWGMFDIHGRLSECHITDNMIDRYNQVLCVIPGPNHGIVCDRQYVNYAGSQIASGNDPASR